LWVGKAWISLDSLGRIDSYQWVTRDFQRKIFPRAFVVADAPSKRRPTIRYAKRPDCSWGKLNLISDFLQEIAARVFPSSRFNPKAKRLSYDFSRHGGEKEPLREGVGPLVSGEGRIGSTLTV
jgi:hypothetical protein